MKYLAFLFLLIVGFTFSQNPNAITYGIDEGLPTSNVYCAFEDDDGFVWFGTDVGVLRYDGYSFEHLSTDDGLGDNEIFEMFMDSQGRIWFLTLNGQLSFYQNGQFVNSKNNSLLKEASHPKVMMDAYENGDDVYFLFRDGNITRINMVDKSFDKEMVDSAIFGHWKENDNYYYLSLDAVLNTQTNENYFFREYINSAMYYRNISFEGRKLFSINNTIYEFKDKDIVQIDQTDDEIIHMNKIDENLWLGTRSGLVIKQKNESIHYFMNDVVSYVLKDTQNNYWVTTLNDGIKFIPNFNVLKHDVPDENLKITAVVNHEDQIFVGTESGLYTLNYDSSFSAIQSNKISTDYIKKVRYYNGQVIAIGNTSVKIIEGENVIPYDFGANDFYYDGSHYFFSSSVVFKFLPEEIYTFPVLRKESGIRAEGLKVKTLFRKRTNVILPYKDNALLFGTSTGLNLFKDEQISDLNVANDLNTSILDLYYDANTDLVFAVTNSLGISILKGNKMIHQVTKKQGLSSNSCYSIHPYDDGYLVGTNKGIDLVRITENGVEVESVNRKLHLKNEKINAIEVIDDLVLVATDKGLISFDLKASVPEASQPKLVVESTFINEEIVSNLNELRSDQNNLRMNFTGISFIDFGNLTYQYRDNDGPWIELDNRVLEIQNLTSGFHNIQIRARGITGNWSNIKQLSLFIKTPFWRTVPFIIIVSLVLAIIVYFIVGKRIKSLEKAFSIERKMLNEKQEKMALEKQMIHLEQKALRMQMNPHFVFNALNTIKGYYTGGEIKEANRYIGKFSKLLRMILETDQRLISLEKEIEIIELYLELINLRYENVFKSQISVSPDLNKKDTAIPILLLQPMIENAIIHGLAPKNEQGELIIEFLKEHDKMICRVIDNGVGFTKSKESKLNGKRTSKALQITRERVEMENDSMDENNFIIRDREGMEGTEVIIKLPIINYW